MSDSNEIVAIIDDDPDMCDALTALVSAYGYDAHSYNSAETFLTCASTCRASCLLVDIQLGDLSGIELARQLAADGFKFPIIFMSGRGDATTESQALAVGGIAFLRKPFPTKMLIDAINALVKKELLKNETRNDKDAITDALYRYLDCTLGRPA